VQIGDLARRVGVRVDTLRAWERRYGLLQPHRSEGGFRLYSHADEAVVRAMIREIDRGFPPSQAARLALQPARQVQQSSPRDGQDVDSLVTRTDVLRDELLHALANFDGEGAHARLDTLLSEYTLNTALANSSATGCSAWRGTGTKAAAPERCWPAPPVSATTSA
jgi:MerR family transcriptional regulator, light-induced transcriptional regulator